jgi:glutamate--cysteine ligase
VAEIENLYQQFRDQIDPILDKHGLELVTQGYHPSTKARELDIIPKKRYAFMDEYFKTTGDHGICMMRATASTQVSIDYFSEADAIDKFRVANTLGPLLAFITDNTPVFEGRRLGASASDLEPGSGTGHDSASLPQRMARMTCWDDTDPWRCLTAPSPFDEDYSFRVYAENVLNAPAIFLPGKTPGAEPEYHGMSTFASLLGNTELDENMILHILSLFIYDVRFKSYVEIRQADSLPIDYALAYTALIKGIFYNPEVIQKYAEAFKYIDPAAIAFAKTALRRDGFAAIVYQRQASEWLDQMLEFAYLGLPADEHCYLEPLARLIKERRSLID